jgi:uncharacterized protein GlcG (DUF336 family)
MTAITLEQATTIIEAALGRGRELDCEPLTVAVLDPGGHVVALQREDGSGILRPQIAHAKAWGALGMGFGTRELERRSAHLPAFVDALSAVAGGRLVPIAGGVLVRDADGDLLGAVGISGDTSERDEDCAVQGVAAADLVADTGA